jgi:hypothetical protein
MDPFDRIDLVESREDLVTFVRELLHDFETKRDEWENVTLEDYLESVAAWVEDADPIFIEEGIPTNPPSWKTFAHILYAAKIYE